MIKIRFVISPFAHSFVRYLLNHNNIEIKQSADKKCKILFDVKTPPILKGAYEIREFKPALILESFGYKIDIKQIKSIEELNNFGFSLYRDNYGYLFLDHPKKRSRNVNVFELFKFPPNHYVEYEAKNKTLKIKGDKSAGEIYYVEGISSGLDKYGMPIFDGTMYEWDEPIKEVHKIILEKDEIPVGICYDERLLVCIQKGIDKFAIGFVGVKGAGKTIYAHSLCHFMYKQWGIPMALLNDWNYEMDSWNRCADGIRDRPFIRLLKKLDLRPESFPCLFLIPNTNQGVNEKDKILFNENLAHIFTLSWSQFIRNYNDLTRGYKELELGKSGTAIDFDKLSECKSVKEVEDMIDSIQGGKEIASIKGRLRRVLSTLINSGIFDINKKTSKFYVSKYENVKGIWDINKRVKISGASEDCVPSLLFDARINVCLRPRNLEPIKVGDTNAFSLYLGFLIKQLLEIKSRRADLTGREVGIFVDEFHVITQKGVRQPFIELVTGLRHPEIYFLWASQSFEGVIDEVKTNTDYLFCTYYDREDALSVVKNRGADKKWVDEIVNLKREKFGAVLFPSRDLICYDLETGKKKKRIDPIKISLVPPPSKHKRPGEA